MFYLVLLESDERGKRANNGEKYRVPEKEVRAWSYNRSCGPFTCCWWSNQADWSFVQLHILPLLGISDVPQIDVLNNICRASIVAGTRLIYACGTQTTPDGGENPKWSEVTRPDKWVFDMRATQCCSLCASIGILACDRTYNDNALTQWWQIEKDSGSLLVRRWSDSHSGGLSKTSSCDLTNNDADCSLRERVKTLPVWTSSFE